MIQDLMRYRTEVSRALANHHYEIASHGVLFPRSGLFIGGAFVTRLNGEDERIDANVVLYDGIDDILKVYFKQSAQRTAFYVAPFSNAVDPPPDLKAAQFPATMGEFTHYTEATRPVWTAGDVASQSVGNAAAPARFTSDATGGNVWGAALTTASAKSSTSGLMVCCARFGAVRALQNAGDKLDIEYTFVGTDAGA